MTLPSKILSDDEYCKQIILINIRLRTIQYYSFRTSRGKSTKAPTDKAIRNLLSELLSLSAS